METLTIKYFVAFIILMLSFSLSLSSCKGQPPLKITPLHPFSEVYQFDSADCERRLFFFTVNRDIRELNDTNELRSNIDTLLGKLKEQDNSYCEFTVLIFKETEELNSKFISNNKRHPEQYSKYLVAKAHWIEGQFLGYSFYKDGQVLSPNNSLKLVPLNNSNSH